MVSLSKLIVLIIYFQELVVPKDDFFVGLEYLYDGVATVGVRLKLHFGGFTRWIGGKNSMSTLSVYLGAESSPRQEFESFRDQCVGKREADEPAFPMEQIIGITGIVTDGPPALQRATGIGVLVRKIVQQNLFSYYWVQDVLDTVAAAKVAAAKAAAAMKAAAAAARAAGKMGLAARRHRLRSGLDGESLDGIQSLDTTEASSKQHLNTERPHSSAPLERPLSGSLSAANEQMKPSEVHFFLLVLYYLIDFVGNNDLYRCSSLMFLECARWRLMQPLIEQKNLRVSYGPASSSKIVPALANSSE